MTDEEKKNLLDQYKLQSAVPKLVAYCSQKNDLFQITTGYHALDLIHFLTCGTDEVRCWTVRKGSKAPQAAGTIHTDFEKGFICAEVMKYEDFKVSPGEYFEVTLLRN
jgi:obg-like ATPase 1